MGALQLLTSSDDSYLRAVTEAIEAATHVTLVTAFASPLGVELLTPALEKLLTKPNATARLVLGMDRQGFNTVEVFRALLVLEAKYGSRVELNVVAQQAGLLHAKALLTEGPDLCELLVGSANLTSSGMRKNHELTLHVREVPAAVRDAFKAFLRSLYGRPLNQKTADSILGLLGAMKQSALPREPVASTAAPWAQVLAKLAPSPLAQPPDEFVNGWIGRGFIVGRGRSTADALSIRLPLEALAERKLIQAARRRSIGDAARESRTLGYSIDLLPALVASEVRKTARRIAALPARLGLRLPCFGLWMPASFWPVFEEVWSRLQESSALDRHSIVSAALAQREYLLTKGGIETELAHIIERLRKRGGLLPANEAEVRSFLAGSLKNQLERRAPEDLVQALEFRTGRQCWSPAEKTDAPYRQLLVDIVQSVFSAAHRTGRWPTQVRSYAAREIVYHVARAIEAIGEDPDGSAAGELLALASSWEDPGRPFLDVLDEFRRFIPDEVDFKAPNADELIEHVTVTLEGDVAISEPEDDDDV